MRRRTLWGVFLLLFSGIAVACTRNVPDGFNEYTVFDRLDHPTAIDFAADGRVFVSEKRGIVQVFDSVLDDSPTALVDLRTNVFNGWDRGLLDLELAPTFPADESVYVLYTYDAPPGETAPRWGTPGADGDNCPDPPGVNTDGCVVTARLSRLPLDDGAWTGEEDVLIHDWCQQYPSHSIGTMQFGPDGALYVGGGDGASYSFWDYGQRGIPLNPCGDPPGGVGAVLTPPTAQGGTLRSQDIRTLGDPTTLAGSIIRIDPATGEAMPDNPRAGAADPNVARIVAHGFRNPFRFTLRPGTDELWVGDVGHGSWEEINRSVGGDAVVDNFGWPCYEGNGRVGAIDQIDLSLCESLYAAGPSAVRQPWFSYAHRTEITPDEDCATDQGSSTSGVTFAPASSTFPGEYDGALFFADASRGCIWVIKAGSDGLPDPSTVAPFVAPAGTPVELTFGPDGDLWYVDHYGGRIMRIGFSDANHPPVPAVTADPTSGDPPLTVEFDASGSSDPDAGDVLAYAWDLDDDGMFDDGTAPTATTTFTTDGLKIVRVRVTDMAGDTAIGIGVVPVGDVTRPTPIIELPEPGALFEVGDPVTFSGTALDPNGDPLPASTLSWRADLLHCPSACHRHDNVFQLAGAAGGSFPMPDHEYPAALELRLTATSGGQSATATRIVDYRSTSLTIESVPAGVDLSVGTFTRTAPFTQPFATNGLVTLSAPATATVDGVEHVFTGWSDGGARSHEITVPDTATTVTATYAPASWTFADGFDDGDSAGWTVAAGTWAICPPPNNAPGFAWCGAPPPGSNAIGAALADGPVLEDGLVAVSTVPSDAGGKVALIARAQDAEHYYSLRLDDTPEDRRIWRLQRRDGPTTVTLTSGMVPHLPDTVYRLRLIVAGDELVAELSTDAGQTFAELGRAIDGTYASGKIGLESRLRSNPFDDVAAEGY